MRSPRTELLADSLTLAAVTLTATSAWARGDLGMSSLALSGLLRLGLDVVPADSEAHCHGSVEVLVG